MRHLTFDELKDSTPIILLAIADALASDDPDVIRELVNCAPGQGLSRFTLNFDVVEVMQEDRLLRAIIVQHVEAALGRRMDVLESAALHAAIDVMLQRSVIALVERQKAQLRAAAETELKFVSFLSHDLNNNLSNVNLWLQVHEQDLKKAAGVEFAEAVESLVEARRTIEETVAGMRQMLDYERLRKTGPTPRSLPVDVQAVAARIAGRFEREASAKGVKVAVEVWPGFMMESEEQLLSLVLQNLVGNGVKYSSKGTVRIGADADGASGRQVIWVSDEGPGIGPETADHIFEAFRRGDVHGQCGVGLGLAIASQAAKQLGATLTVESRVGVGSTFRLAFRKLSAGGGSVQPHGTFAGAEPAAEDRDGSRPLMARQSTCDPADEHWHGVMRTGGGDGSIDADLLKLAGRIRGRMGGVLTRSTHALADSDTGRVPFHATSTTSPVFTSAGLTGEPVMA
jgi:signal transduction histidine kinase